MNALLERLGLHGNDPELEQPAAPTLIQESTRATRREHVLAVVFYRFAELYDKTFYRTLRRFTEFSMLIHSLLAFSTLTALHFTYINNSTTSNCFVDIKVPHHFSTVLRIEVKRPESRVGILGSTSVGLDCCDCNPKHSDKKDETFGGNVTHNSTHGHEAPFVWSRGGDLHGIKDTVARWIDIVNVKVDQMSEKMLGYFSKSRNLVVEYSESSGLLLLSEETRKRIGVHVSAVTLDPDSNRCFGTDVYRRVFLEGFFGFRDVVTISLENFLIANNLTEGYYRTSEGPITKLNTERTTPLPQTVIAAVSMVIFVAFSSLLLQFSYNTISSAVVDLVYFNNNLSSLPIGPIIVSVIAIIGFRDLMKYMFYDNMTFTLNLLIIWMANQFYTFFCHCSTSKRHWLKFFFLYHFVFYVYYVRYKGRFASLAMTTSWFFIQHSKMYFFHHYELPAMHSRLRVQRALADLRRDGSGILDRLRFRVGRDGPPTDRWRRNSVDANDGNNNIISDVADATSAGGGRRRQPVGAGNSRVRLTFVLREPR